MQFNSGSSDNELDIPNPFLQSGPNGSSVSQAIPVHSSGKNATFARTKTPPNNLLAGLGARLMRYGLRIPLLFSIHTYFSFEMASALQETVYIDRVVVHLYERVLFFHNMSFL